jgi:WD40 repeat protein
MDGFVRLWAVPTGGMIKEHRSGKTDALWCVQAVAFCSDKKTIAAGCSDGQLHLWDTETDRACGCFAGHPARPPGSRARWIFGGVNAKARSDAPQGVTSVAFSPDGKLLVSTGSDGRVRLLNLTTGVEQVPDDP